MPSALLLSPDDQAVSAVTAVLEEMFVSCERPLDAVSAAKKLNSENYDLVLVDCENLPAAKLIFDVCRRGKDGHISIPIAIVDGHAGLPTAFRLGADLVLTKPVAKDQARSTIRSAVNRVKKEQPVSNQHMEHASIQAAEAGGIHTGATHVDGMHVDGSHVEASHVEAPHAEEAHVNGDLITNQNYDQVLSVAAAEPAAETRAMAAAASAGASANGAVQGNIAKSAWTPPVSTMSAAAVAPAISVPEIGSAVESGNAPEAESKTPENNAQAADEGDASKGDKTQKWKPAPAQRLVFAGTEGQGKAKKKRDVLPMVAAAVVLCGGFCAAWLTQTGFRSVVRARVEKVLTSVGLAKHTQSPTRVPVKPAAVMAPVAAQSGPAKNGGTQPVTKDLKGAAAVSAPAAVATTAVAPVPSKSAPTSAAASPAPSSPTPGRVAQVTGRTTPAANSHKHISTSDDLDADLTIERIDVVLPAKSAADRLISSVPPVYPAAAHGGMDNSVILKAAIDETGKVAAAQLVDGDGLLGRAAIAAVKHWRYQPYMQDGRAVPFQTIVLVDFPKR
ncbi:MAG: TonB family protein [Terriglobales bacterium]|jgi:protein TonB